jgi:hypothetical protein
MVNSKSSSVMGMLMKMSFATDGKPARVQRRALLSENSELVFEGRVYALPEQAGLPIKIEEA